MGKSIIGIVDTVKSVDVEDQWEQGNWEQGKWEEGDGERESGRRGNVGSPCTGFFWTGSTSFSSNEKPAWFSERWRLCRRREGEEQRRLREGRKVGGREERERREEVGSVEVFLT